MPLLPMLIPLTVSGIHTTINEIRSRKKLPLLPIILILGTAITITDWTFGTLKQPSQSSFVAGNALLRTKNYKEALQEYFKALQHDSRLIDLYLNIGVTYLSLGDTSEAEAAFEKEIKKHSSKK